GDYCGNDGLGLDANTLYSCTGGAVAPKQQCANGCVTAPAGTNDYCHARSCPGGVNGLYCGSDGLNADPSTLYDCENGTVTPVQSCGSSGCHIAPSGQNDYCENACSGIGNG